MCDNNLLSLANSFLNFSYFFFQIFQFESSKSFQSNFTVIVVQQNRLRYYRHTKYYKEVSIDCSKPFKVSITFGEKQTTDVNGAVEWIIKNTPRKALKFWQPSSQHLSAYSLKHPVDLLTIYCFNQRRIKFSKRVLLQHGKSYSDHPAIVQVRRETIID